ncbi:MAG: hypothetical protein M5U09_03605 [Gammaproteobacteria bacterium]|nr:hypothetical protein [Gammaproteobacteria bacterium]
MRLLLAPEYARSYEIYTPVAITYTLVASGRTVALQKPLYPRRRLLRGNRHSGYENASGAIELLGWSTGAPMLYDAETAVGTSSALWRGALQPAANYETGSTAGNAPARRISSARPAWSASSMPPATTRTRPPTTPTISAR